jgi:hypothetical protein
VVKRQDRLRQLWPDVCRIPSLYLVINDESEKSQLGTFCWK